MKKYDFDLRVQEILNKKFSDLRDVDWKSWLRINSLEEYEELALELSGLGNQRDLIDRLKEEKTESRELSVDLESYVQKFKGSYPLILTHTSGTTNSQISALKWFHMSDYLIRNLWGPGMQAIFESSGLNNENSAVVFVPSRLDIDGLNEIDNKKYISLYSAEFSQRIMLSAIKPKSYLFYQYKVSSNIETIADLLSLKEIAIVSAPSATILKWANLEKLKQYLKTSLKSSSFDSENYLLKKLLNILKRESLTEGTLKIRKLLSNALCNSKLVFSISSLSESQWNLIRDFMKWKKGEEKFTNLYVCSEIGPFASSLPDGDYTISKQNKMYILPLTIPCIQYRGSIEIIPYVKNKIGKLLVSRLNHSGSSPILNIDTGDIISIEGFKRLPLIGGNILRDNFQIKYPLKISKSITKPDDYAIYAGDFFTLKKFDIIQPRILLNCIKNQCNLKIDYLLLVNQNDSKKEMWKLVFTKKSDSSCINTSEINKKLKKCSEKYENYAKLITNVEEIKLIDDIPVKFVKDRQKILEKVRSGKIPKGILKKWPLYLIMPSNNDAIEKNN
ncbi:MAG: hypothetical protein GF383_00465 [Candidatus Lokiarchaeota archaeon]|nr:hypothetical protein [Candidatus Lokiarchaeota archaeon]MBD3337629.1 hypothetical protein [Candidatus Lokiarchaeota archaeon]